MPVGVHFHTNTFVSMGGPGGDSNPNLWQHVCHDRQNHWGEMGPVELVSVSVGKRQEVAVALGNQLEDLSSNWFPRATPTSGAFVAGVVNVPTWWLGPVRTDGGTE